MHDPDFDDDPEDLHAIGICDGPGMCDGCDAMGDRDPDDYDVDPRDEWGDPNDD